jgi:hypothetical protein
MGNKARDIRSALGSSLRAEESRVADRKLDRFARADAVMEATTGLPKGESPSDRAAIEHHRVTRDSFSLPVNDYALLGKLQERGLKAGVHATKSELVRAGLKALMDMKEADFLSALKKVEKIKTGRPSVKTVSTV